MKAIKLIVALAAVTLLAGCVYVTSTYPSLTLSFPKSTLMSGELSTLSAVAYDPYNGSLSYVWKEDGATLDATGAAFVYSRFVTAPTTVVIQVEVMNGYGETAVRSRTLSLTPPAYPASLVVQNSSPYSVYYLYLCAAGESEWGPDQMRPTTIIPAGSSYTVHGIPSGTWNVKAVAADGVVAWTNVVVLAASQTKTISLY